MRTRSKIVIAGATGNLGTKISEHLRSCDKYDLVRIDIRTDGDPGVVAADLSRYDESWARHLAGADAVIHMVAEARPHATWDAVQRGYIDAVLNVYLAAAANGARRVIFKSSTHAMEGYRWASGPITEAMPAKPVSIYGAAKLTGERIGRIFAERHGISVICLRLGWVKPGENRPGPDMGLWGQQGWLSNRDLCQGVERAIVVEDVGFVVLNLLSDNAGMRWDLGEARRVLGYRPDDGCVPLAPSALRGLKTGASNALRRLYRHLNPPYAY